MSGNHNVPANGADRAASLLRLTQQEPVDIDGILAPFDARRNPVGQDLAPGGGSGAVPPCPFSRPDEVVMATRVTTPPANPTDVAFRLMGLSVEQDVEVVVFSDLDYSGLERFGFRTERIAGTTPAEKEACIAQLRSFWGIELMI
jgi:hypothetical protein